MEKLKVYQEGKRGAFVGIATNIGLFCFKAFAGIFGRSHAMMADALHTASDLVTSAIVFIGFKIASIPPDPHHPYGHGKAESIAAKLVALFLIGLGLKVGYNAVRSMWMETYIRPHQIALWAAISSILVKEVLFRYVYRLGKRINSSSLIADARHHRSDVYSSIAALVGIGAARLGWPILDPIVGVAVSAIVIKMGCSTFHSAYDELMDAVVGKEVMGKIKEVTLQVEDVKALAGYRARKMGMDLMIDMDIMVDGAKTVAGGHAIAEKVKAEILANVPGTKEVLVHVEPYRAVKGLTLKVKGMKFNINNYVKVKLRDRGREILKEQHEELNRLTHGALSEFKLPKEDRYGWSEWQLWNLISTFGENVHMGQEPHFETEIVICEEKV